MSDRAAGVERRAAVLLVVGEPFGPLSFVGAAVVVAGLWLTQTGRPAPAPAPA